MLSQEELLANYWANRLRNPRWATFFVNILNCYFQYTNLVKPLNEAGWWMNVGYSISSLFTFILVLPSFYSSKYNDLVRFGFMLCSVRQVVFVFNIPGTREEQSLTNWTFYCHIQLICATYALHYHVNYFDPSKRGHLLFAVFYLNLIIFGVFFSVYDMPSFEFKNLEDGVELIFSFLFVQLVSFGMARSERAHAENISEIFSHIQDQHFLRKVLDSYGESIIIMDQAGQISYSNPQFCKTFSTQLACPSPELQSSSIILFEQQESSLFVRARRYAKRARSAISKWIQGLSITDVNANPLFFSSAPASQNHFPSLPLFRKHTDEEDCQPAMSLEALVANTDLASGSVFQLLPSSDDKKPSRSNTNELASNQFSIKKSYLKLNISSISVLNANRTLVQIADVSDSILYDKSREQNELLALINATVSHELRNPLNAIVSQNILKECLYAELGQISEQLSETEEGRRMHNILEKLQEGMMVQDSSAKLMGFLVQDFLDYAQIKSGKFRLNLRPFNIREAVEKVMCIQRDKAQELGLDFTARFGTIGGREGDKEGQLSSPVVCCDEQRIMQVLLNIQSNALKFTKEGSVTIAVDIVSEEDGRRFLTFEVADTGVGIPYEDQDKLFKLFGFVQSTAQYNQNGIGLGLVISEKIVAKLGGTISFTSVPAPEPNHGTSFKFKFELKEDSPEKQQGRRPTLRTINSSKMIYDWQPSPDGSVHNLDSILSQSTIREEGEQDSFEGENSLNLQDINQYMNRSIDALTTPSPQRRFFHQIRKHSSDSPSVMIKIESKKQAREKRILIVDDQVFNIQALKLVLQLKLKIDPAICDHALNGEDALKLVKDDFKARPGRYFSYDLILMDCNMPFMDGFECTRRIRQFFWDQAKLPVRDQPLICAVTGHAEPQFIRKCFTFGMNQVLSKPIEVVPLCAACKEAGYIQ